MKRSITIGILVAAVFAHATAYGQVQDKNQQKCINALNKAMAKISAAQLKANAKCASDFAKAKNMNPYSCWATDPKVSDLLGKVCPTAARKCGQSPTLGPTSCGTVANYAESNAQALADDLFYFATLDPPFTFCASDKAGCKCQAKSSACAAACASRRRAATS